MCSARYAAALALAAASLPACGSARSRPATPSVVAADPAPSAQAPAPEPGRIAGRILAGNGQPMAGVTVAAVAMQFQEGREILVPIARADSTDGGEFVIGGVPAGRYLVSASDPAVINDETGPLRYPPTYFPGVVLPVRAERVTVPSGGPSQHVEFRLQRARPSRVSGAIRAEDGRQLVSGAVLMTVEDSGVLSAVPPEDVTILPDGTFAFRNVPPGRYQIRARGEPEGQDVSLFATFALTVDSRDVSNITMTLAPGGSIEGRVTIAGDAATRPSSFAGLRVRAPFADGTSFGDAPTGDVQADGSFRIRGVMSGAHYIRIEGLPQPWVLQRVGYRGEELIDVPFDVARGERLRDVRVTITDRSTQVQGAVRSASGSPAPGAVVIVLPLSSQFWTRTSRRLFVGRAGGDGRFVALGLPAGEYRAFASLDLDEAEAYRPEVLRRVYASGAPLSLADRESRTIDVTLAPTQSPVR